MNSGVSELPPSTEKPPGSGMLQSVGAPPSTQPTSAPPITSAERGQQHRPRLAGLLEQACARGAPTARPAPTPTTRAGRRQRLAQAPDRHRVGQAAVAEEEQAEERLRLRRRSGSTSDQQQVPHQQLQQDRHVAEQLDVAVAQAAHQRVVREAADAQQRAQDGRQHDADDGHAQRVEHADQEGHPVRVARRRRRSCVSPMSKPAGCSQEVEAALDAAHTHVRPACCGPGTRRARPISAERDRPGRSAPRTARLRQRPVALLRWGSGGACRRPSSLRVLRRRGRAVDLLAQPAMRPCGRAGVRRPARVDRVSAPAGRTSGRRCSTGCSGRAAGPARSSGRHCARRSRRSCRPP